MKGAVVLDLEPLTVFEGGPVAAPAVKAPSEKAEPKAEAKPPAAVVTPIATALAAVEPHLQRRRDSARPTLLPDDFQQKAHPLTRVRNTLPHDPLTPPQ